MNVRIAPVDTATLPEDDLRHIVRLLQVLGAERVPEDPPDPYEVWAGRLRTRTPSVEVHSWLARETVGEVIGYASVVRFPTTDNPHFCETEIVVHPEWRRRGAGRALLDRVADAVANVEGALLVGGTNDRVPAGEAFARRIGATPGIATHTNQLDLAAVDRGLLAAWRALADTTASAYRLHWIPVPVPGEWIDAIIAAHEFMNDAPRGELEMRDWHMTPQLLGEWHDWLLGSGLEPWLLLARYAEKEAAGPGSGGGPARASEARPSGFGNPSPGRSSVETGETAGFTQVAYDPRVPHVVHQYGTGVARAHRGRGLGKLLKATMLERILAERPAARYVRTGNADVNAAMLAINRKLGFRPAWAHTAWQAKLPAVRAYLEASAARAATR